MILLVILVVLLLIAVVAAVFLLRDDDTASPTTSTSSTPTTPTVSSEPPETTAPAKDADGVVSDGDVRTGRIDGSGQKDTYDVDLGTATEFRLVETTGDFYAVLKATRADGSNKLPGPFNFRAPAPGKYKLEITGADGASGEYSFRMVTLKPRKFSVKMGDRIGPGGVAGTGKLDAPGRVDIYTVDATEGDKVLLEEVRSECDVHAGVTGDEEDPAVSTPYQLCGDSPSMRTIDETGKIVLLVWTDSGKPADYAFRLDSKE